MVIWKYQGKVLKFFFFEHRVRVAWNEFKVPSRRSKGQRRSGQPSESWRNFNRWPPRSQNLGFPKFDVMRLGILARMANLLSFLCVFLLFLPGTTFTEYGKILFLRILQDFELFLGVSCPEQPSVLENVYRLHDSFLNGKARTFYVFPFQWCHYLFKMLCSKFSP